MPPTSHQLRSITLGDEPRAWSELGFDVRTSDGSEGTGTVRLAKTTLVLTGSGGGFEGWEIDGSPEPIDGLPVADRPRGSVSAEPPAGSIAHPNGIASIDHVVISTDDMERTADALAATGLEARGGRSTTSYGSPMRQQFYWLGDVILELVGPGEPDSGNDNGNASGSSDNESSDNESSDSGSSDRRAESAASLFGLALVASDLDTTLAYLGDLAGRAKDAVQPGRRIAGLRTKGLGIDLPLAVMSPHPG